MFKNFVLMFSPNEIKEAYGILYEIDRELGESFDFMHGGVWRTVRYRIEEYLILNSKSFLKTVREGKKTPREIVYRLAYYESATEIEMAASNLYTSTTHGFEQLNGFITKKINKLT